MARELWPGDDPDSRVTTFYDVPQPGLQPTKLLADKVVDISEDCGRTFIFGGRVLLQYVSTELGGFALVQQLTDEGKFHRVLPVRYESLIDGSLADDTTFIRTSKDLGCDTNRLNSLLYEYMPVPDNP